MKKHTNEQIALRVSLSSLAVNVALSVFKLLAGIFSFSYALISDAVHSFSDVFSELIVIAGVKAAGKKGDDKHPYGHERFECVAAIILSVILCVIGLGIGISGVKLIVSGDYKSMPIFPSAVALTAAAVSIAAKECMFWVCRHFAKRLNSVALKADAWHNRVDALSSVGSLIGLMGARLGVPVLDPIASLVICVFIVRAALLIFIDAVKKMVDTSCGKSVEDGMRTLLLSDPQVLGVLSLRTRLFGDRVYAEAEIAADGSLPLVKAEEIARRAGEAVEQNFPEVKRCTVRVVPKA